MGILWIWLVFGGPGLVLPLIFGVLLWHSYSTHPLGRAIALFVLKPLLATPIVMYVIGRLPSLAGTPLEGNVLVVMAPGALLTLLLVAFSYRHLLNHPRIALFILAGDAVRWVFPYIILTNFGPSDIALGNFGIPYHLVFAAWIWTSAYAIICWSIARRSIPRMVLKPAWRSDPRASLLSSQL